MTKVLTILGTRPEIIRLSRTIELLDNNLQHVLVHTGQNHDYTLNEIFFKELKIRKPNYYMGVDNSTLGKCIGEIIIRAEEIIKVEKPDALLILGDTNSALAAIIAKRMNIPIFHMEAGNRSFDLNVPEEINRKMIDHISDFHLVYTEHARRNLIAEGVSSRFIYLIGSPMKEVLDFYKKDIEKSLVLDEHKLCSKEYIIVSIHREENTDDINRLLTIIKNINKISKHYKKRIIFPIHPRTKDRLQKSGLEINDLNIEFIKPLGFNDYIKLQENSYCTISDSGTISEESSILKFPSVTLRNSLERPEALDNGSIIISNETYESLLESINIAILTKDTSYYESYLPNDYKIKNTSLRVLSLIISTAKNTNNWLNRNKICRSQWD
tara:strand:- start:13914 stop:15062 length:1149 start_codon:yes stop_codon:yes gene_type:complete